MAHQPALLSGLVLCFIAATLPREASGQNAAGEVALSDESLQLRFLQSASGVGESSELGFGLFLNENRDILASSHYYVEADELRFNRLTFKAGPVAYAAMLNTENTDIFSVALGAEVRFEFLRRQELYVVAQAAYAPDILTFGSADNLFDFTVRIELPLTDRVIGFGGYRLLDIDLLNGSRELEESPHLGIRYTF